MFARDETERRRERPDGPAEREARTRNVVRRRPGKRPRLAPEHGEDFILDSGVREAPISHHKMPT